MLSKIFSTDAKLKKEILINSREIVSFFSVDLGERTLRKYDNLNDARNFIIDSLIKSGYSPKEEKYKVDGKEVSNIIVEIKGYEQPDNIILVGAHYDTVEDTPGADDNATSIAALLELARLMSSSKFKKTIRFVAFTLEEPPFFSGKDMGSMRYAAKCKKKKENIELMIAFDMLGFSSRRRNQDFPALDLKTKYPATANYLAVISFPSVSQYAYLWKKIYNENTEKKIYEIIGPASIPGIDFSDHSSFSKNGYPAILLTDTGFYRNKNYHGPDDTFNTINFRFLSQNIRNIFVTLTTILNMNKLFS